MIKPPAFIRHQPRLAFYAFAAVAASGFGQTFFVSVMGGELRQAFGLSHTAYGSLYSGATVLSAACFFSDQRGNAVAMAQLGFPLAEAVLPAGSVLMMGRFGWRGFWLAGGLFRWWRRDRRGSTGRQA